MTPSSLKFQDSDIDSIRIAFADHPLFKAIDAVCYSWESETAPILLSPAEIFWRTACSLDYIDEKGTDGTPDLERFSTDYYTYFLRHYPDAEKEAVCLSVTLLTFTLAACLAAHTNAYYGERAQWLFCDLKHMKHQKAFQDLRKAYPAQELEMGRWMRSYMKQPHEPLSEAISRCFTHENNSNQNPNNRMEPTYNINNFNFNAEVKGDVVAGDKHVTNHYSSNGSSDAPKQTQLFRFIDLSRCTLSQGKEAEEILHGVANRSPKEIVKTVYHLQQICRLGEITNKVGFVREFNHHFGVDLNEKSFDSAWERHEKELLQRETAGKKLNPGSTLYR